MLPSRELAEIAVKALDSKKGKEIRLIRIDKITTLAEYFVICTGTSNTQINALCDAVEKELTEKGEEPLHREGYRGGTWVLTTAASSSTSSTTRRASSIPSSTCGPMARKST